MTVSVFDNTTTGQNKPTTTNKTTNYNKPQQTTTNPQLITLDLTPHAAELYNLCAS